MLVSGKDVFCGNIRLTHILNVYIYDTTALHYHFCYILVLCGPNQLNHPGARTIYECSSSLRKANTVTSFNITEVLTTQWLLITPTVIGHYCQVLLHILTSVYVLLY